MAEICDELRSVELPKAAGDTGAAPPEAPPQIVRAEGATSDSDSEPLVQRRPSTEENIVDSHHEQVIDPATGSDAEHAADGEPASKKAKTEVLTPTRTAHPALAGSPGSTLKSQKGKGKGKQAKRTSDMAQEDGPTKAAEEQPKKPKKGNSTAKSCPRESRKGSITTGGSGSQGSKGQPVLAKV